MKNNNFKKHLDNYYKSAELIKKNFIKKFKKIPLFQRITFYNYILKRSQKHKFHIVSPSPWPFLTSISAFLLVTGLVTYMHKIDGGTVLVIGVLCVMLSMYF